MSHGELTLPLELVCYLCERGMVDPVMVRCSNTANSRCQGPSICASCMEEYSQRLQSELCPSCGGSVLSVLPNVALRRLLGVVDVNCYNVNLVEGAARTEGWGSDSVQALLDIYNKDIQKDNVMDSGERLREIHGPDQMRATEYKLTNFDMVLAKSLQKDGVSFLLLPGRKRQTDLCLHYGVVPVAAPRGLAAQLGVIYKRHNYVPLPVNNGGMPYMLTGVGEGLGNMILETVNQVYRPGTGTEKDHWETDDLGRRGVHVILCYVSGNETSLNIGGLARVEDAVLGFLPGADDVRPDTGYWPGGPSRSVPSELVEAFRDSVTNCHSESAFAGKATQYAGVVASTLSSVLDAQKDVAIEGTSCSARGQICWFLRLNFLLRFDRPHIMIPLRAQPIHQLLRGVVEEEAITRQRVDESTESGDLNPVWAPREAAFPDKSVIPAVIAKIRASEASTSSHGANQA